MSASSGPIEGPSPDWLARARCLVPLLGRASVRLASLGPALHVIREVLQPAAKHHWQDDFDRNDEDAGVASTTQRGSNSLSFGSLPSEFEVAAFEFLSSSVAASRFSTELAELCSAEGQWLAALALAPQIAQKLGDDFALLSVAVDALLQSLNARSCSSDLGDNLIGRTEYVVDAEAEIAAQPGASREGTLQEEFPRESDERILPGGEAIPGMSTEVRPGLENIAGVLRALLSTSASDLKNDVDASIFIRDLPAPETEVAEALRHQMLRAASIFAVTNASRAEGTAPGNDSDSDLLEQLARLEGFARRTPSGIPRELEAAEQYFRALAGALPVVASSEPRPPAGGRDALVSEAQAGGGSALHRWIRVQVQYPAEHELKDMSPSTAADTNAVKRSGSRPFATMELADVPHEYLCPIGHDVMRDAVSTCDGHTYERRNIEAWLAENSTSPVTGLPLANKSLIPNHSIRKLIFDSGVLAQLGSDTCLDAAEKDFRTEVCCEISVPSDAMTLEEALRLGSSRAVSMAAAGQLDSSGRAANQGDSRSPGRSGSGSSRMAPVGASKPLTFGVRLEPGKHFIKHTLQIDQDVEIIGSGPSNTTLRLAPGAALEIFGEARIARLAISRDSPPPDSSPVQKTFRRRSIQRQSKAAPLLDILKGSCCIELCDISNSCGSAARISGAHTSPRLSRNTIHSCRDASIIFRDGADGFLVGCRLFSNLSVAIEIYSRADPVVEDNDVFDGRQGGIFVHNRGKGHMKRNKIFKNALEGVEIKQGGRPLVEDNDIYDNLECGIFIHEAGEGRIIGNRIHSNSYAGIEIKDASCPEIRGNDVYSGRTSGVYIHGQGQGVIEDNQVHQNALHGVYVRNRGNPHLIKNRIFGNDECGIFITENSNPCIESNEVYGNGLAGIEVKEESNPTIKLNRIHDGNTGGIFILARGRGHIYENKLWKNNLEGIEIKDGGDPHITDNDIFENKECGIFAHDGALGRIEENRIYENAFAGIEIKDSSNPVLNGNHINRGQTSGLYVHSGGRGKIVGNDISENYLHGVMILSGGQPFMSKNKIHDNLECGVVAHMGYAVDALDNHIHSNRAKDIQAVKS